jgi:hypothetical protein
MNYFEDHVFEKFCTKSARKLPQLEFDFGMKLGQFGIGTLIKNTIKFPHIQGNSDGIGCKVIYEEGFLIYEEMRKYLDIYEEGVSHK